MDKSLFVSMSGQRNSLTELEMLSNDLANSGTIGFKADYEVVKQNHVVKSDDKMETRVYPSVGSSYTDFKQGTILQTGRDLDAAIPGKGMFTVQSRTGKEGYSRAGNFEITADGFLTTSKGEMVLGSNGAINIPKAERLNIAKDGTITIMPLGGTEMVPIAKLKLVNPDVGKLQKGEDGLFYMRDGNLAVEDKSVTVASGALEGSNVNTVETLIKLIDLSRRYEIHSNFVKNLADQASQSNKLLDVKA